GVEDRPGRRPPEPGVAGTLNADPRPHQRGPRLLPVDVRSGELVEHVQRRREVVGAAHGTREVGETVAHSVAGRPEHAREHLVVNMPELSAGDDDLREETRASVEGNVDQVLRLFKLGAPADALVVPPDAAELVRGMVRRGITLAVLLRTYRLGHAWFWDVWC